MLLKLSQPVEISPVNLDYSEEATHPGRNCMGYTEEHGIAASTLQEAVVPAQANSECQQMYGATFDSETMFCAGMSFVDACRGDSGGPALSTEGLVGVISFGVGCGRPEWAGVYSRIAAARKWIDSTICAVSTDAPETCKSKPLTIEIQMDGYPSETSWSLVAAKDGSIVLAGFGYIVPNAKYYYSAEPVHGEEYLFRINDQYGDGMCCEYGSGYYRLLLEGTEIGNGGDFASSFSQSFRFSSVDTSNIAPSSFPSAKPRTEAVLSTDISAFPSGPATFVTCDICDLLL